MKTVTVTAVLAMATASSAHAVYDLNARHTPFDWGKIAAAADVYASECGKSVSNKVEEMSGAANSVNSSEFMRGYGAGDEAWTNVIDKLGNRFCATWQSLVKKGLVN